MDKELVRYYRECVRTAAHHVKEAQDALAWWQARLVVVEADLENARTRLREAQEAGEEASARTDDGRPINDIWDS